MNRDSVVWAISGTMFGLLVGWILGTQQGTVPVAAAAAPAAQQSAQLPAATPPPPLDVQRAATLERQANSEPGNATVRVDLGNLYFDAERYDMATSWYQAALKINPKDVNASTDLAVSYYSSNQIDQALAQFEVSLKIDPTHTKTLLNQGIVLALGKQDLEGALKTWNHLISLAPASAEAAKAREIMSSLTTGHSATPGAPKVPTGGGGGVSH